MDKFNTPIAFIIFRRPEETSRVFEMIRKIKPTDLLIIADGGRNNDEIKLCNETREIVKNIDWPCNVRRNYSDINMGCKSRVSSGISWVFENVDRAIIIEDDCLPNKSFFTYCQNLLEKYKDDHKIMHISGLNMQKENADNPSYYFSNIAQIWGWATWKRAWDKYDVNMKDWPRVKKDRVLLKVLKKPVLVEYFEYLFDRMYRNELTTWDVAWTYTCMKEDGLCITPNKNLIKNIGFGNGAAHSRREKGNFDNMETSEMIFPLNHPQSVLINNIADDVVYKKVFGINSRIGQKVLWFFKSNFPKTYSQLRLASKNIKLLMK